MKNHPARTALVVVLVAATWTSGGGTASAQSNPIQIENAKEGSTDWLLTRVVRMTGSRRPSTAMADTRREPADERRFPPPMFRTCL
jgi:hypothetical protein